MSSSLPTHGARFLQKVAAATPEIVFFVVTTASGLWAGGRWLDTTSDTGVWLSLAHRIANGERPYRDIFMQYGPLSPYLLAFTGAPFDFSLTWFRLVNWIPAILAGLLLLALSRPFLSRVERLALVGLLIGFSVLAPRPARMVLPYSPGAVHALCFAMGAFLCARSRGRGLWTGYAAGVLAGLALCEKQEIGIAAILGLGTLLVTDKQNVGWVARCLVGFAAAAAAGMAIVLGTGVSLDSLIHDSHFWPLATVPPEWRVLARHSVGISVFDWRDSLREAAWQLAKLAFLVSLAALLLAREKRRSRWLWTLAPLTGFLLVDLLRGRSLLPQVSPICLSMTVAFVVALLAFWDRQTPGRDVLVAFAMFAGLAAMRTAFSWDMSGPYSGVSHFATNLTWLLLLLCLLPKWLPGGGASALWARRVWAIILISFSWYWAVNGIDLLKEQGKVAVSTPRGTIFSEARWKNVYTRIGAELRPGERALFLPEAHGLDVLFRVSDSSPLLGHLPGWLDSRAEETLIRRFEARPPDIVVLFDRPTLEFGVAPFGRGFGRKLAAWIDGRYRPVSAFPGAVILRHKVAAAISPPAQSSSPHVRIQRIQRAQGNSFTATNPSHHP